MSDFDKEAEREKLREKYERDKEERKATQRMSDLLLKGATMTNAHCGTCGDPLFQQNGTTFCPSCHGNPDAVQGTDLEAQPTEEQPSDETAGADTDTDTDTAGATAGDGASDRPDATDANATASSAPSQRDDQRDQGTDAGTSTAGSAGSAGSASRSPSSPTRTGQPTPSESDAASSNRDASSPSSDDRPSESKPHRRSPGTTPASDGDIDAARDALVRSLQKFAEEAAETDDPRYAKTCLEAAREAGETLSTFR